MLKQLRLLLSTQRTCFCIFLLHISDTNIQRMRIQISTVLHNLPVLAGLMVLLLVAWFITLRLMARSPHELNT
mgnify:CR=1 FL=1